uniref:Uncharacterized protein n=1 Tax=Rhizophora mucronata TaxID=61149 RepID=A0A2P2J330_RHIMU
MHMISFGHLLGLQKLNPHLRESHPHFHKRGVRQFPFLELTVCLGPMGFLHSQQQIYPLLQQKLQSPQYL